MSKIPETFLRISETPGNKPAEIALLRNYFEKHFGINREKLKKLPYSRIDLNEIRRPKYISDISLFTGKGDVEIKDQKQSLMPPTRYSATLKISNDRHKRITKRELEITNKIIYINIIDKNIFLTPSKADISFFDRYFGGSLGGSSFQNIELSDEIKQQLKEIENGRFKITNGMFVHMDSNIHKRLTGNTSDVSFLLATEIQQA